MLVIGGNQGEGIIQTPGGEILNGFKGKVRCAAFASIGEIVIQGCVWTVERVVAKAAGECPT